MGKRLWDTTRYYALGTTALAGFDVEEMPATQ